MTTHRRTTARPGVLRAVALTAALALPAGLLLSEQGPLPGGGADTAVEEASAADEISQLGARVKSPRGEWRRGEYRRGTSRTHRPRVTRRDPPSRSGIRTPGPQASDAPQPAPDAVPDVTPAPGGAPTPSATPSFPPATEPSATPVPDTGRADFPNASNTGVPAGIQLADYTGPLTITRSGTVIDGQRIVGDLVIRAKDVTITRSHLVGGVFVERSGSLTMSDSVVDGERSSSAAVGQYNYTLRRVEVVGARVSAGCSANCTIEDSWLHAQYMKPGSDWHGDGFLSNGGSNMVLKHNTLACDSEPTGNGGACSAAVAAYGDFSPITHLTVDNNLFVESPAGYCMYGGYDTAKPHGRSATDVRITNNVFERGSNGKCAVYGAATAIAPESSGNVFSGNVWSDGKAVSQRG